jgi:hypothetical protein
MRTTAAGPEATRFTRPFAAVCVLLISLFATHDAAARTTRLYIEGDDWHCGYGSYDTWVADRLLVATCRLSPGAPSHFLFDWRASFMPVPDGVRGLSADARWAVRSGDQMGDGTQVWLYDLQNGSTTRVTTTAGGSASAAWNFGARLTADGERVLFTSGRGDLLPPGAGDVAVLEWRRSDASFTLRAANAHLLGASADGDVIVVFNTHLLQPWFALHDRDSGSAETYCVPQASVCEFLGLSPDGRWLAYAHAASGEPVGRILRDRTSGEEVTLPGFVRGFGRVRFDHDSERMAYVAADVGSASGYVLRVRQLADGSEQAVFFDRPVYSYYSAAAFGPDRLLAVNDSSTTAIVSLDALFEHGFD